MKIVRTSSFKDKNTDIAWFYDWAKRLESANGRTYEKLEISTSLGTTLIWKTGNTAAAKTLVLFPGFRTSPLFWDLDRGLDYLINDYTLYLVETNGQPNPSDGNTPAIRSNDYGLWALEVLNHLKLGRVFIAGASFGGLVCMKLALVAPERVHAAFLLNPGCLQAFSMKWKNLYANTLPMLFPKPKNIRYFLETAVFCKPEHSLTPFASDLIVEFELKALTRYRDRTQKPYFMGNELEHVAVPVYLFEGDQDTLFPYKKSIAHAHKHLKNLKEVVVFQQVGHGIETYRPALALLAKRMNDFQ